MRTAQSHNNLQQKILSLCNEHIYILNSRQLICDLNKALPFHTQPKIIGKNFIAITPKEYHQLFTDALTSVCNNGELRITIKVKSDKHFYQIKIVPADSSDTEPTSVMIAANITQQKLYFNVYCKCQ